MLYKLMHMHDCVQAFQLYNAYLLYKLMHMHVRVQAFQLYNAYVLYKLSLNPHCTEWQVRSGSM